MYQRCVDRSSQFMGKRDIYQLSFGDICELWIHISRGKVRSGKNPRDSIMSKINKSTIGTVSRVEIGNLLDNFKTYILGSLSEQIDTLKIQNKKEAVWCSSKAFLQSRARSDLREPLSSKL